MLKKVPHTFVIVFSLIVVASILTWFIPGGEYQREKKVVDGIERTVIVDNSFHATENSPQTWQVFTSLYNGFVDKADIIIFILIIGGAFWIMNLTKSIDVGIFEFLRFTKKIQHWKVFNWLGVNNVIIVMVMLLFSVFGAVFGMSEETIAFIVVLVPLAIRMGYDSIVGVCMVFVGAGLGFAGAILNPFTIGIAQGLSDIKLYSGIEYRMFCWLVINLLGIIFVLRYANKIYKNPKSSVVYEEDHEWRKHLEENIEEIKLYTPKVAWISFILVSFVLIIFSFYHPESTLSFGKISFTFYAIPFATVLFIISNIFSLRKSVHFYILNLLLFTIYFLIIGVVGHGWYISEIATLFLAMGIITGISYQLNADTIAKEFLLGVKDILSAAIIVGLAGGIIIIMKDGKIIDPILHSMAEGMKGFWKIGTVSMMYLIQNGINIIIPSGSAKAALTMPIMAPFSDVIGISRQATVMAYQLGDGFTNMITPTSGVLIAVLGVARIPYAKWFKFILPLMILLIVAGFLLLIPTVTMPLNDF